MKFLPLIWSGLWRRPVRTWFTLASIAIAFLLFGLLQGVNAWFGGLAESSQANRLYVVSRVSQTEPLPISHLGRIQRVPGVRRTTYVGAFPGVYQSIGNEVLVYATDVDAVFDLYPEWHAAPEQLRAMKDHRTGAIVGAALMKQYGWRIGDRLPLRTSTVKRDGSTDWNFEIVGSYGTDASLMQANLVLINYAYFDEERQFGKGQVFAFMAGIDNALDSARVCAAIDALFVNSSDETLTQNEKEFTLSQLRQLGDVNTMVNAIVGAVLFTLLFLTGNTMMQSVRERIPELASLKAIGYSDRLICLMVLVESVLLCVIAAVCGLATAGAVFPVTKALGIGGGALPIGVVAAGMAMALLLAASSGLPPARRAMRLAIVDALAGR